MIEVYLTLGLAAALGGAINSVAGGGTLITFPALYHALGATAQAAVLANGTSTVALLPGALSALWGYRREMSQSWKWAKWLTLPCLLGGTLGGLLVTRLPAENFRLLIPWLILTAAALFALQPAIARWTGLGAPRAVPGSLTAGMAFQFLVAVYGGYFGAGIGILMLCSLGLSGMADIHQMNAVKSLLGSLINLMAAIVFIQSRQVDWSKAIVMTIAASAGGYFGARLARRLDRRLVRFGVIAIGFSLAAYYFYREFFA